MKLAILSTKHQLLAIALLGVFIFLGMELATSRSISAQPKGATDPWKPFHFLLGQWESNTDSTGATGGSTFAMDLKNTILVRKNFADYPATNGKSALHHEDLLVMFQQAGNPVEANYWDNEGHVIHYLAKFSEDQDTLALTSDVIPNAPRFRLSYIKLGMDSLKVGFEFAPPGSPDGFKPYLSGLLHKK